MKLRVVGWTYYEEVLGQGEVSCAVCNAVIDDIKKHGYMFSGWMHQEGFNCTPVLNNGKKYCFSQRGWGSIMAEAHGYNGIMDYAKFTFAMDMDSEIRPKENFNENAFIPECNLNERFELEVSQLVFDSAQQSHEIKLDNLTELRYLDAGDTLVLISNNIKMEYTVVDVDCKRDMTEERERELWFLFHDYQNTEKNKAKEELENAKIIMVIKLA